MVQLAGCAITNSEGDLLVLHRQNPERSWWELPGGKIETHETPAQAARRELVEELGLDVEVGQELGSCTFGHPDKSYEYHWFAARIVAGTPKPQEPGFDDARYFSWAQLAELEISPNLAKLLERYPDGLPARV